MALAVGSRAVLVDWSVRAVSEPLFLALSASALVTVLRWRRRGGWRWLVAAVALAGASAVVRYVGVATVVAVAAVVLSTPRPGPASADGTDDSDGTSDSARTAGTLVRRVGLSALCGLAGLVPVTLMLSLHDRPSRGLSWHPPRWASWRLGGETLGGFLVPPAWPSALRWVGLVVLVALVGAGTVLASRRPRLRVVVGVLWLFVGTYAAVLIASATFVDGAVPLGDRHLLPIALPLLLLASIPFAVVDRRVAGALAAVVAVLLAIGGTDAWRKVLPGPVTPVLANDFGPVTGPPAPAATGIVLDAIPDGAVIVSNEPSRVWLTSGRRAIQLPQRTWPDSLTSVTDRDERFAQLDVLLERPGSVIVVYRLAQLLGPQYPSQDEIEARLRVHVVAELDDAVLLAR